MASDAALFDWPGTTIYAKFTGTSLKIIMGGGADIFYDVFVNNELIPPLLGNSAIYPYGTFHTNGQEKTFEISSSLPNTEHTLRIIKRTETAGIHASFKGIELDASAHLVPDKPFINRRIEFIGDSYVAGYGNQSPSKSPQEKQDASGRDCLGLDLAAYTNTGMAYGPLTAQSLDADFQINAYSGLGMTRHYNGSTSFLPFQDYYKRTLVSDESTLYDFSTWNPDIVVIALGTNDFSTALGSNEIYQTRDDLYIAYQNKYKAFIAMIREKHVNIKILALANNLYPDEEMKAQVKSIVDAQKAAGFQDIYFKVLMNTTGYGCGWHPDIATHSSWSKELHTEIENIMNW
jgi:lysophospholipase L1-like esterase